VLWVELAEPSRKRSYHYLCRVGWRKTGRDSCTVRREGGTNPIVLSYPYRLVLGHKLAGRSGWLDHCDLACGQGRQ